MLAIAGGRRRCRTVLVSLFEGGRVNIATPTNCAGGSIVTERRKFAGLKTSDEDRVANDDGRGMACRNLDLPFERAGSAEISGKLL